MTIPSDRIDRELQKFVDVGGYPYVRMTGSLGTTTVLPNLLSSGLVTMAAATTGSIAAHPIFTVTGVVGMTCFAICGSTLTSGGASTIEVGTTLNTAGLIALITSTNLATNEIWHDASPDASIELDSVLTKKIVVSTVNYKVTAFTVTGGTITFYCSWYPISPDGNVVAVSPVV